MLAFVSQALAASRGRGRVCRCVDGVSVHACEPFLASLRLGGSGLLFLLWLLVGRVCGAVFLLTGRFGGGLLLLVFSPGGRVEEVCDDGD